MDLLESIPQISRWKKAKEMAFGGLDPIYRFQGNKILFDHPQNLHTGIFADVFLISKIKNKDWIWGWSIEFPVPIDTNTIKGIKKDLRCKNKYLMKSPEDEASLIQLVCEKIPCEIILEISLSKGASDENCTYYIGLNHVVTRDVSQFPTPQNHTSEMIKVSTGSSPCCSICSKEGEMKRCSGCKMVFYCSPECQMKDWKSHKLICKVFASE